MEKIESFAMKRGSSLFYAEFHGESVYELALTTFSVKNGQNRALKFQFVWEKIGFSDFLGSWIAMKFVGFRGDLFCA